MIDLTYEIIKEHGIVGLFGIGFIVWAYVVLHFGRKILNKLDIVGARIESINYKLSNRVTKVEAHLETKDSFKPYRNGD